MHGQSFCRSEYKYCPYAAYKPVQRPFRASAQSIYATAMTLCTSLGTSTNQGRDQKLGRPISCMHKNIAGRGITHALPQIPGASFAIIIQPLGRDYHFTTPLSGGTLG